MVSHLAPTTALPFNTHPSLLAHAVDRRSRDEMGLSSSREDGELQ